MRKNEKGEKRWEEVRGNDTVVEVKKFSTKRIGPPIEP